MSFVPGSGQAHQHQAGGVVQGIRPRAGRPGRIQPWAIPKDPKESNAARIWHIKSSALGKLIELAGCCQGAAFCSSGTKLPTTLWLCYPIYSFRSLLSVNKYKPG